MPSGKMTIALSLFLIYYPSWFIIVPGAKCWKRCYLAKQDCNELKFWPLNCTPTTMPVYKACNMVQAKGRYTTNPEGMQNLNFVFHLFFSRLKQNLLTRMTKGLCPSQGKASSKHRVDYSMEGGRNVHFRAAAKASLMNNPCSLANRSNTSKKQCKGCDIRREKLVNLSILRCPLKHISSVISLALTNCNELFDCVESPSFR